MKIARSRFAAPRRAAPFLAVASLMPLAAVAGDTPADVSKTLDAVVVTASGFEQKITDAPASISRRSRHSSAGRSGCGELLPVTCAISAATTRANHHACTSHNKAPTPCNR